MRESSVIIAVSSVHRKEALEATDYAINELKAESAVRLLSFTCANVFAPLEVFTDRMFEGVAFVPVLMFDTQIRRQFECLSV